MRNAIASARGILLWATLGAGLLLSEPVIAAEFLEYYKLGLDAAEAGQWDRAAELMERAIAEQPEAKIRVAKSFFFRRYLPHFHLGQARFERGDCRGALAAWEESESQAIVTRFPEYQKLQEGKAACRRISELETALDEVLGLFQGAAAAAADADRQLSMLSSKDESVRGLLDRQATARADLDRARRRIESNDAALEEVEQLGALAGRIREEFAQIQRAATERRRTEIERRRLDITGELASLQKTARSQLASIEYLRPYPERIDRRRRELLAAVERARSAGEGDLSMGELEALRSDLERAVTNLQRAVEPPPEELRRAVEAYFARDYQQVLDLLTESRFESAKAGSHAHMLQAAALFSLYRSTGSGDDDLLERARQEVLSCYRIEPGRVPPPGVFSPAFVTFFDQQIAASADEREPVTDEGP